jgi:hypothetical protein
MAMLSRVSGDTSGGLAPIQRRLWSAAVYGRSIRWTGCKSAPAEHSTQKPTTRPGDDFSLDQCPVTPMMVLKTEDAANGPTALSF